MIIMQKVIQQPINKFAAAWINPDDAKLHVKFAINAVCLERVMK